jgi:hypothetical protein
MQSTTKSNAWSYIRIIREGGKVKDEENHLTTKGVLF